MEYKVIGPHAVVVPEGMQLMPNDTQPSSRAFMSLEEALREHDKDGFQLEAIIPGFQVVVNTKIELPNRPNQVALVAACALLSRF